MVAQCIFSQKREVSLMPAPGLRFTSLATNRKHTSRHLNHIGLQVDSGDPAIFGKFLCGELVIESLTYALTVW